MNKHFILLFLPLVFFSYACSEKEQYSSTPEVSFIPKDSIRINEYTSLKAYDYDKGVFLLGDVADGMSVLIPPGGNINGNRLGLLLVDNQGVVLGKFNNTGEGPVNHGISSSLNILMDDQKVGLFSRRGFFIYDYNGGLVEKIEEINSRSLITDNYIKMGASADGKLVLGATSFTKEAFENQDNPYPFMTSFKIFDLNKTLISDEKVPNVISSYGYPEGPADETIVFQDIPFITINRKEKIVNVLFNKFKRLNQYNLTDGELVNSIELSPLKFQTGNEPPGAKNARGYYQKLALSNSKFLEMVQLGEYTLIRYNSAIPTAQVEQLVSTGGPSDSPYWERLRDSVYKFYYLLIKNGEIVKQDFEIKDLTPQKREEFFTSPDDLRGQIIGGDDLNSIYVLYNNDYSQERPFKLIVRYSLVIE